MIKASAADALQVSRTEEGRADGRV
jgi:predicted cupin superfamily sugar epimerase